MELLKAFIGLWTVVCIVVLIIALTSRINNLDED